MFSACQILSLVINFLEGKSIDIRAFTCTYQIIWTNLRNNNTWAMQICDYVLHNLKNT